MYISIQGNVRENLVFYFVAIIVDTIGQMFDEAFISFVNLI